MRLPSSQARMPSGRTIAALMPRCGFRRQIGNHTFLQIGIGIGGDARLRAHPAICAVGANHQFCLQAAASLPVAAWPVVVPVQCCRSAGGDHRHVRHWLRLPQGILQQSVFEDGGSLHGYSHVRRRKTAGHGPAVAVNLHFRAWRPAALAACAARHRYRRNRLLPGMAQIRTSQLSSWW